MAGGADLSFRHVGRLYQAVPDGSETHPGCKFGTGRRPILVVSLGRVGDPSYLQVRDGSETHPTLEGEERRCGAVGYLVLLLAGSEAGEVTVTPLSGAAVSGRLAELSEKQVVVETAGGRKQFEAQSLQAVQAGGAAGTPLPLVADSSVCVVLLDGSTLAASDYRVQKGQAIVGLVGGGTIEVPTRFVRSARFNKQEAVVQQQWQEILDRRAAGDMVVIRKVAGGGPDGGEATNVTLDHLQGILSDIDAETVGFEFDGTRVAVPRRKVEGIVYYHPPASRLPPSVVRVTDVSGSTWNAQTVNHANGGLELVTCTDVRHVLAEDKWNKVDYSTGNLVFLSELPTEAIEWQPYVESTMPPALAKWFQPKWNSSIYGGPLLLDNQSYERGLAVHSRSAITFRLADPYQRFRATVGIDDRFHPHGNVRLVVSGDQGPLFERNITGRDPPLDLDRRHSRCAAAADPRRFRRRPVGCGRSPQSLRRKADEMKNNRAELPPSIAAPARACAWRRIALRGTGKDTM